MEMSVTMVCHAAVATPDGSHRLGALPHGHAALAMANRAATTFELQPQPPQFMIYLTALLCGFSIRHWPKD
jgi:hypothetical protein